MRARRDDPQRAPERDHGEHTLRVHEGVVVGLHQDDVFVELGPRMQGVISRRKFERPPEVGEVYEFTLGGQEESLWALSLREEASLSSWEEMEVGSLVNAHAVRRRPEGLELKIGPLHAFMPKSHTGIPRGDDFGVLVGRTFTCEVLEVDAEKQRVLLSRKLVLQRERDNEHQKLVHALKPGAVVQGRVVRIEAYGAFVSFGAGLQGLLHVSNLSHERVEHPSELLEKGQHLAVKVLHLRDHGKRIGLGLKQMSESPWKSFARGHGEGDVVSGQVKRLMPFGAFVSVVPGIEGLLHRAETGLPPDRPLREHLTVGSELSVRICELDAARERLALSLLFPDGARIDPDEAANRREMTAPPAGGAALGTSLGDLLRRALDS